MEHAPDNIALAVLGPRVALTLKRRWVGDPPGGAFSSMAQPLSVASSRNADSMRWHRFIETSVQVREAYEQLVENVRQRTAPRSVRQTKFACAWRALVAASVSNGTLVFA